MGLLELPDLRHTLVDIGTTLLCISGYNGLPGRILTINLIHETAQRSERVDNAALSSAAVSYETIIRPNDRKAPFCTSIITVNFAEQHFSRILVLFLVVTDHQRKKNKYSLISDV